MTLADAREVNRSELARKILDALSVEQTGMELGDLEIIRTFHGDALVNYVADEAFDAEAAIPLVRGLDDVLRDYVSDSSLTSNFNKSHGATFYRRLHDFLPCLLDIVVEASEEERLMLARVRGRAGTGGDVGQLQTAPISVGFHSLRPMVRRAIVPRDGLEA